MSQPQSDISNLASPTEAHSHRQASSIALRIFAACTTSVVVAVNYTNYGPLIPQLSREVSSPTAFAGGFCIRTPPQFGIPRKACRFGLNVRRIGSY